jgi:perosamine synthetase
VQCALGLAQLKRLPDWIAARQARAAWYDRASAGMDHVSPLVTRPARTNVYHLYVIRLNLDRLKIDRQRAFAHLRDRGIGANVHYAPVYRHSFYQARYGHPGRLCPAAETVYQRILTLPMFPSMSEAEAERVIAAVDELKSLA